MALSDLLNKLDPQQIVDLVKPYLPEAVTKFVSGNATYIVGGAFVLSGVASVFVPLPWVPLGSEGEWIAVGVAIITGRRALGNTYNSIQENTAITKELNEKIDQVATDQKVVADATKKAVTTTKK